MAPPTEPCALRSTQPLKVSTRDFSWGKVGRCVWLTTYHPCSAETSRKSGALTYPEPLGPPRPVVGLLLLYYNLIGLPTCMRSVVDRNVVMRRMTSTTCRLSTWATKLYLAHLCTYRLLSLLWQHAMGCLVSSVHYVAMCFRGQTVAMFCRRRLWNF